MRPQSPLIFRDFFTKRTFWPPREQRATDSYSKGRLQPVHESRYAAPVGEPKRNLARDDFPVATTTDLKLVKFEDWPPGHWMVNDPVSNRVLQNHLPPNLQRRDRQTLHREIRLSRLPSILKNGASALVHADAEDVLKLLTAEPIKARLVLIDPPYNRRTKFHHYDDSTCRKHWLSSLSANCSRLRDLLTDHGSLWMHIDDAEMPATRTMLDMLFGPKNFVATIVWKKTVSRDNRTPISTTHEYVLVYAKNKSLWFKSRHKLPATAEQQIRYKNPDRDPRGPWTSGDLTAKAGPGRRSTQFYRVTTPSGRIVCPATGTCWRFTKERFLELMRDNRIDFGKGDKMPRLKRFLSEVDAGLVPHTWWEGSSVGTADTAKRHLKALFPALVPFETPKPERLTARILHIATDPGDLVIDVYGGSGTTAAVALKMRRRWVVAEREQRTFYDFTLPRVQIVADGRDEGGVTDNYQWNGGGKFTVFA